MTLIAEARGGGNSAERRLAGELAPRELDAQLAHVSRARGPVDAPKHPREMHRMHTDLRGEDLQGERLSELTLDQELGVLEPDRRGPFGRAHGAAQGFGQNAERETVFRWVRLHHAGILHAVAYQSRGRAVTVTRIDLRYLTGTPLTVAG
jgi:hypothetical protein